MRKTLVTAAVAGFAVMSSIGLASAQDAVRVWHTETSPESQNAMAEIVSRFEAAHPDIKVEVEALAWGDLEGKIQASLAAGSPP